MTTRNLNANKDSVKDALICELGNCKILIVDDTKTNIDILVHALKSDYKLQVALDGVRAIESVKGNRPDLILLDIMMPGMNGFEVCHRLREDPATTEIPIIFITAMNDSEHKTRGLEAGAVDYITKPFNVTEVKARVKTHLLLKNARGALKKQNLILENSVNERTAELRESEFRFRSLFENCKDAVFASTTEGLLISMNPAGLELFDYSEHELQSIAALTLYENPVDRETFIALNQKQGFVKDLSLKLKKKNGEPLSTLVTATVRQDAAGNVVGYHGIIRDVTEQKLLERQLVQAQKLESIGQLAAGIAHEINTPIQYVGHNTRFLQEAFEDLNQLLNSYQKLIDTAGPNSLSADLVREIETTTEDIDLPFLQEEIPAAIKQSLEGVESVIQIVRSMKEFSHPGITEKIPTDINRAIRNTIAVARNEWKYVAELMTDLDPDLLHVPCLPGEFNQVILNMIINAAHAISDAVAKDPEKPARITISTRNRDAGIEIRIADTGSGIPAEDRLRIFDPFFTTKEPGKGTGQGLAISHAVIVKKHGGTIEIDTEINQGTTFIIQLPTKLAA